MGRLIGSLDWIQSRVKQLGKFKNEKCAKENCITAITIRIVGKIGEERTNKAQWEVEIKKGVINLKMHE